VRNCLAVDVVQMHNVPGSVNGTLVKPAVRRNAENMYSVPLSPRPHPQNAHRDVK